MISPQKILSLINGWSIALRNGMCPQRTLSQWPSCVYMYADDGLTSTCCMFSGFPSQLLYPFSPFGHNYDCSAGLVLQLSRAKQMSTALKDLVLLHSRTNENVKKRLFSLARKQRKGTKRIKPWEACRLELWLNLMLTWYPFCVPTVI